MVAGSRVSLWPGSLFPTSFPAYREVVMHTSKCRSENPSSVETPRAELTNAVENGRDARGRFAPGNAGGPGNPFARRVAQLRKVLLEAVSDEDLRVVAEQLVVKAKMGDLAATKLLLQYVVGKPAATVDPDALDVEEVELYKRAPAHGEVTEIVRGRVGAETAAEMLRLAVPRAGAGFADTIHAALENPAAFWRAAAGLDAWDEEDEGDVEEEAEQGGMNAGACQPVTPPSTNGPTSGQGPRRPEQGNGDSEGQWQSRKRPGERPPPGR
jgi:hypothetical protein